MYLTDTTNPIVLTGLSYESKFGLNRILLVSNGVSLTIPIQSNQIVFSLSGDSSYNCHSISFSCESNYQNSYIGDNSLLKVQLTGSYIWDCTIESNNWPSNYELITIDGNSGTYPISVHLKSAYSATSIISNNDIRIYLETNVSYLSSLILSGSNAVHVINAISTTADLYIASAFLTYGHFYSDNVDSNVNIYFGQYTHSDGMHLESNAKYHIRNYIKFYSSYQSDYSISENIFDNDHFQIINNLAIEDNSLIDLSDANGVVFLNENISFPGTKYFVRSGYDHVKTLGGYSKPNSEEEYYIVLCQPRLDCNKFELSMKDDDYYRNPSKYWQEDEEDRKIYKKTCKSWTEVYPQLPYEYAGSCCDKYRDSNDITRNMYCLGFEYQSPRVKSTSFSSSGEDNYYEWKNNMLFLGINSITYGNQHLFDITNQTFKNAEVILSNSESHYLVGKQPSNEVKKITFNGNVFFHSLNSSSTVIPFEELTIAGTILNPVLSKLDFSKVKSISLSYSEYARSPSSFSPISTALTITINSNLFGSYTGSNYKNITRYFSDSGIRTAGYLTNETSNTIDNLAITSSAAIPTISITYLQYGTSNAVTKYYVDFSLSKFNYIISPRFSEVRLITDSNKVTFSYSSYVADTITIYLEKGGARSLQLNLVSYRGITLCPGEDVITEVTGIFTINNIYYISTNVFNIKYNGLLHVDTTVIQTLTFRDNCNIAISYNTTTTNTYATVKNLYLSLRSNGAIGNNIIVDTLISVTPTGNYYLTLSDNSFETTATTLTLNMNQYDSYIKFANDASGSKVLKKINIEYSRSGTCDDTLTIYKRAYPNGFANLTHYDNYAGYTFVACSIYQKWANSAATKSVEYCPNQNITLETREFTGVSYVNVNNHYAGGAPGTSDDVFRCLGYKLHIDSLETNLLNGNYTDVYTTNGPEIKNN